MMVSQAGIDLIKRFEGFKATPYTCPAGKLTVGYGHVINSTIASPISKEKAEELLKQDVSIAENSINSSVKVALTQGQFDALVSLVYNWGSNNFLKSQGLKCLNRFAYVDASREFFSREKGIINISGKFSQGLYNRRLAELELWNSKE